MLFFIFSLQRKQRCLGLFHQSQALCPNPLLPFLPQCLAFLSLVDICTNILIGHLVIFLLIYRGLATLRILKIMLKRTVGQHQSQSVLLRASSTPIPSISQDGEFECGSLVLHQYISVVKSSLFSLVRV